MSTAEHDTWQFECSQLMADLLARCQVPAHAILWAVLRLDPHLTNQGRRVLTQIYDLTPVQLEILEGLLPTWAWDDELRSIGPLIDASRALA